MNQTSDTLSFRSLLRHSRPTVNSLPDRIGHPRGKQPAPLPGLHVLATTNTKSGYLSPHHHDHRHRISLCPTRCNVWSTKDQSIRSKSKSMSLEEVAGAERSLEPRKRRTTRAFHNTAVALTKSNPPSAGLGGCSQSCRSGQKYISVVFSLFFC